MIIKEYIFGGIVLIAIGLLFNAYAKNRKKYSGPKSKESFFAGIWWFVIFFCGIAINLIYYLNLAKGGGFEEYLVNIANSIMASIKMFGFDFKADAINTVSKMVAEGDIAGRIGSIIYACAFVLCFVCAGIWTNVIIINTFFKGVINNLKIYLHAHPFTFWRKRTTHYIVLGAGKQTEIFIKDLKLNNKEKSYFKRDDITIIIGKLSGDQKKADDKHKELIEKGYVAIGGKIDEQNYIEQALIKAGLLNTKRETRVIALSDNDEENIAVADIVARQIHSRLSNYDTFNDDAALKKSLEKINLEARIMYSFIERTEHFAYAETAYGKIRFFNPYEIRVRDFFWKNPVTSFIPDLIDKIEWKGRLAGNYNGNKILKDDGKEYQIKNIFVGFGAANMQMLRGSILTGQLLGADYNAYIFDNKVADYNAHEGLTGLLNKKLSPFQARFANHSSGLFKGGDTAIGADLKDYFASSNECYNINFTCADILSRAFYNKLIAELKNMNFAAIYIALGSDKLSIETALEIRQSICENGVDHNKIKIFVKIRENSSLNAEAAINAKGATSIVCYGTDESIFTWEQILNEDLDKLTAKITNKNHGLSWELLSEAKRESNRQAAIAARTKLQLLGFDFVFGKQPNHEQTYFDRYFCNAERQQQIFDIIDHYKDSSKKTEYLEIQNGLIADTARNNLARLEHLRWNTYHLLNGWTKLPASCVGSVKRQEEQIKQHACITTFEELINLREMQKNKMAGNLKLLRDSDELRQIFTETFEKMFSDTKKIGKKELDSLTIKEIDKDFIEDIKKIIKEEQKKNKTQDIRLLITNIIDNKLKESDKELLGDVDSIYYDFSLMDEILRRRLRNENNEDPPRIKDAPFSIIQKI